jgi:site-specific recombinase XerC
LRRRRRSAKLQIHHLRRFVAQLHARGLDGRSLARMLSAWRGFYRYLARDHGYTSNPCVGLRAPKAKKSLPQALSPDEAGRLMEIPDDDRLATRDKAIYELFYSSGLRLAELTSLAPADINFSDATVRSDRQGCENARRAGRQPGAQGAQKMARQTGTARQGRRRRAVRESQWHAPNRARHSSTG